VIWREHPVVSGEIDPRARHQRGKAGDEVQGFDKIVLGSLYAPMGMGSFADVLTPEDAKAIHAYVSREQLTLYQQESSTVAPLR